MLIETITTLSDASKQSSEESLQELWDSCVEFVDSRRRTWRFNYKKYASSQGWCIDWEVIAPNGLVKASKKNDSALANRCLDESGLIDQSLLEYGKNGESITTRIEFMSRLQKQHRRCKLYC